MGDGVRQAGRAIRGRIENDVDRQQRVTRYAEVVRLNPLTAKVHDSDLRLDVNDDLVLGQWLRQYIEEYGISVGDTLLVSRMRNGDWIVNDLISQTPVAPLGSGGPIDPADLPAALAWENQINTFTLENVFSGQITATGEIWSVRGNNSLTSIGVQVSGDSNARWFLSAGGVIEWGPGNAARDVNLYRQPGTPAVLKTDNHFQAAAGKVQLISGADGRGGVMFQGGAELFEYGAGSMRIMGSPGNLTVDGGIYLGSAQDVAIYRDGANVLRTDDSLLIHRDSTTALNVRRTVDNLTVLGADTATALPFAYAQYSFGVGGGVGPGNLAAALFKVDNGNSFVGIGHGAANNVGHLRIQGRYGGTTDTIYEIKAGRGDASTLEFNAYADSFTFLRLNSSTGATEFPYATQAARALLIGGDAKLYRDGVAGRLAIDGKLRAQGGFVVGDSVNGYAGNINWGGQYQLVIGTGNDGSTGLSGIIRLRPGGDQSTTGQVVINTSRVGIGMDPVNGTLDVNGFINTNSNYAIAGNTAIGASSGWLTLAGGFNTGAVTMGRAYITGDGSTDFAPSNTQVLKTLAFLETPAADWNGLRVKLSASHTGKAIDVWNNSESSLFNVDQNGWITNTGRIVTSGDQFIATAATYYVNHQGSGSFIFASGGVITFQPGGTDVLQARTASVRIGGSGTPGDGQLSVYPQATGRVGLRIVAFSGQTADLLFIRNSADNATLAKIDKDGMLTVQATATGHGLKVGDPSGFGQFGYYGIAHGDMTGSSYALLQGAAGQTILNAASGQSISFRINNADSPAVGVLNTSDFTLTVPVIIPDATAATHAMNRQSSDARYLRSGGEGAFSVYRNAAVSYATGSVVVFDAESEDISAWFDTSNGRFTPQKAGLYRLNARVEGSTAITSAQYTQIFLRKNGSNHKELGTWFGNSNIGWRVGGSALVRANGTTDYFDILLVHNVGGNLAIVTGAVATYFDGNFVG